jgi:DNA-binding SARP family transcriptional activator
MCDRTSAHVRVLASLRVVAEDEIEYVPVGKAERRLLLLLALNGCRLHVEQALALLWPDADVQTARRRLRHVLHRLPERVRPLIAREGDTIVLRAHTDLEDFEDALAT